MFTTGESTWRYVQLYVSTPFLALEPGILPIQKEDVTAERPLRPGIAVVFQPYRRYSCLHLSNCRCSNDRFGGCGSILPISDDGCGSCSG